AAGAYQFAGQPEIASRALLAARLYDPFVAPGRLHHGPALGDGEAERLLAVDVLARLAGVDGDQGVPVIRRGDDHRIDVLEVEQLAVVGEGGAGLAGRLLHPRLGFREPAFVHVADGHSVLEVDAQVAAPL